MKQSRENSVKRASSSASEPVVVPSMRQVITWAGLIAITCVVGYVGSLNSGFLCDDFSILYSIRHGSLGDIGSGGIYFRPVGLISFAIDYYLYSTNALPFHVVNLVLHILASVGTMILVWQLFQKKLAAIIAGFIFALHPIHPEAVVWVAGRFDLLSCNFMIWAFIFYINSGRSSEARIRWSYILSLVLFVLSCLSKENAFTFPIFLVFYELLIHQVPRKGAKKFIRRCAPFFGLALVLFIVRWFTIGGVGGYVTDPDDPYPVLSYFWHVTFQPFLLMLFPVNRSVMEGVGSLVMIMTGVIFLSPFVFIRKQNLRNIFILMGIVILCTLPSGMMNVASGSLQNARLLYTPSVFFSMGIGLLLGSGIEGRWGKAGMLILIVYMLLNFGILQQNIYPWNEAGKIVASSVESIERLMDERYDTNIGESGKLVLLNVPEDYIGAWLFRNGLPELIQLEIGFEPGDFEIEVVYGGVQTRENIDLARLTLENGDPVWVFNDESGGFEEMRLSDMGL